MEEIIRLVAAVGVIVHNVVDAFCGVDVTCRLVAGVGERRSDLVCLLSLGVLLHGNGGQCESYKD